MKVSLKNANELQRAALDTATKLQLRSVIPVSVFEKGSSKDVVTTAFESGSKVFSQTVEDILNLITAGYEIRNQLGLANAQQPDSGSLSINQLLTQRALAEACEKRLSAIIVSFEGQDPANIVELAGRLEQTRKILDKTEKTIYMNDSREDLFVVSGEYIQELKSRLSKSRNMRLKLTDEIAGRNLNTTITMSHFVVEQLRKHNIL